MAEYIEREKLIEQFNSYGARCVYGATTIKAIISRIELQPAANVAEVKYGEWTPDDYMYYRCSICGYEHDTPEYVTPFCPHCGAKMEGDE